MTKAPVDLQDLRRRIYRKAKSEKTHRKAQCRWRRWSNEYLYDVLGLFWGWKVHPLPSAKAYS